MILTRIDKASDGIWGHLETHNNISWLTLEHAYGKEIFWSKIPVGTYVCVKGMHILPGMSAPFETFEVTQVPGHTDILFHRGNFNDDSEGCILLGASISIRNSRGQAQTRIYPGRMLVDSSVSFMKFMEYLKDFTQFELTIAE